jgi:hypothetical protein
MSLMSFTVVPLHNLSLPVGTQIPFGNGLVLQDVPEWLRKEPILKDLSRSDRYSLSEAKHALVAEYEASAIGEPDPSWKGKEPKSIQELKLESVYLANMALWLMHPTTVCFTSSFHALSLAIPGEASKQPVVLNIETEGPVHCHPNDVHNVISVDQVVKAGKLHVVLSSIPRNNVVWEALRAFWAALTMYSADRRYPFFWLGLEALFGANDHSGEIGFKLSQRIAFFLADSPDVARDLFRKAKKCYNTRSKIVHGRWDNDPKIDAVMADTEAIARTVLRDLLTNPDMLKTFLSKHRDAFLEDWIFSRSTDPPPYPKS